MQQTSGSTREGLNGCRVLRRCGEGGDGAAERRTRRLLALQAAVAQVHGHLGQVTAETRRLQSLQAHQGLTVDERRVLALLRLESEALYLRLRRLWQEFDALRPARA